MNSTHILTAILLSSGVNQSQLKGIFYLLSDFNNKLVKSLDASKENRINWFKDRLPELDLKDHVIEKLLNYLLKCGEPQKILADLKNLARSESQVNRFIKITKLYKHIN